MIKLQRLQKGSTSLLMAGLLAVSTISAVLVVDLARQFSLSKDYQYLADRVALEVLSKIGHSDLAESEVGLQTLALSHLSDHGEAYQALSVAAGCVQNSKAEPHSERVFFPHDDDHCSDRPVDAITVEITYERPSFIMDRILPRDRKTSYRSAVATAKRTSVTSFSVSSGLLSLDTTNSIVLNAVLSSLIGSSINLDAVHFDGLLNSGVTIDQLANRVSTITGLEIHSTDELLASSVLLSDLLSVGLLGFDGIDSSTDIVALGLISNAISVNDSSITLGDLFSIPLGIDLIASPLRDATVNVLELVMTSLLIVNEGNSLGVNITDGSVLNRLLNGSNNVDALNIYLHVTEAPQIAVGPPGRSESGWLTTATTSQIRLVVGVDVFIPLLAGVRLGVGLDVAGGQAALDAVRFHRDWTEVDFRQTPSFLSLALGAPDALIQGNNDPAQVSLIHPNVASINISAPSVGNYANQQFLDESLVTVSFVKDRDQFPVQSDVISSGLSGNIQNLLTSLLSGVQISVNVLSDPNCQPSLFNLGCAVSEAVNSVLLTVVTPLLSVLNAIIGPLLDGLLDIVITPILNILGISAGDVQITVNSVEVPGVELVL